MIQTTADTRVRIRKIAALGLAAGLLLTGCGRDNAATNTTETGKAIASGAATGTINLWAQGDEAKLLPGLLKDFEAENPGVTVNVTAIPWDAAHNKYQTAIAGGTTPDLAQMGTTWMTDFSDAFDPKPAEIDSSGFFPSSVKSTQIGGTSLGVPWFVDTRVLYYRKDLAAKAGYPEFPTTWDGLTALAKALKSQDGVKYGVQLPAGGSDSFQSMLPFLWSNGAQFISQDNSKWTFDTPQIVDALKYYQSFFTDGLANKAPATGAGAAEAAFVNGEAPVLIGGPSELAQLDQAGGPGFGDKYMVSTFPKKVTGTSFIGGSDLVVFKDAKNRDGAWKLAQWLSKPEVQTKWYKTSGSLPALQGAWKDPSLAGDAKLSVFGEQMKDTNFPPTISTWTQVSAAADTQLEQIVKAGKDPAAAMKDLQATADSIGTGK
ncbi:sugar ABC transporter substrate-binding protein [Pseudarthrobacter sp. YAF2]|uniref:sugar ABC transporter substrate-binding protein n=1 Tax=Pseudarthrobacter sp. YAF2 TaxID=3233078 RepID=UPI003F9BA02D